MNDQKSNFTKEQIILKDIFKIFSKDHIFKTVSIMALSLALGLLYIKFKVPVYTSHAQLKLNIQDQNARNQDDDLVQELHTSGISSLETELDVLRSDILLSKVLQKVSNGVKYYFVGKVKKSEFYLNTPILVKNIKIYDKKTFGQTFIFQAKGEDRFTLSLKEPLFGKNIIAEELKGKTFTYNQKITTKYFSFEIENINVNPDSKYEFNILYKPLQIRDSNKQLNIQPASADSSVINLTYEDTDPYRARDFLNYLTKAYINQNIEDKSKTTTNILKFIDQQIEEAKNKLQISSDNLKEYKSKNNIIDIDTKSQEIMEKTVERTRLLEEAKIAYNSFKILKKELDNGNYSALDGLGNEYPSLVTLSTSLQTEMANKDALLAELTPNHPDVKQANQRVNSIINSIKNVANGIEENLRSRVNSLQNSVNQVNNLMKNLPTSEQKLVILERVFRVNEELYSYLLQRKSELSILKASKVSDINILGKPSVALKPTSPNKKLVLITSIFLGLLLSFLSTILFSSRKIKSVEDLTKKTDIPLYGVIPYVDSEDYNKAYVLNDNTSPASEAYRAIRANLDYISVEKKSKVILVTSSVPHEGKTVVSSNLASVIGMSDKKVVILALDLRRPQLHHKFSLPNNIGMSDVLSGKATLKEAIWEHSKYKNLHIVTSGSIPPNPAELLSSNKMKEVIDELRKEYDYIILDTPPVNYVSDATVLFKYSDFNLFVVRSGFTSDKYIKSLNILIESLNLKSNGIILNSVKKADNKFDQFDKKYLNFEANDLSQ